jgi:hypothetical protein
MGVIYGTGSQLIATDEVGTISFTNDNLQKLIQSRGLYEYNDISCYTMFNRFGYLDPYTVLGRTREYIFITKPDLHLFDNGSPSQLNSEISNIPFFKEALLIWKNTMKQLQISNTENKGPFINLISNGVQNSLDLPTIDADTIETGSTYQGFSMEYRQASFESDFHPDFTLEFEDTKFLELYMLFRIYDEYERYKKDGYVSPPSMDYITRRELHDQMAVYKFIVDEDGESIVHYSKIWGVIPKNVPREIFGNLSDGGPIKFSISFKGTIVRDMDPTIITSFNKLVGVSSDYYTQKNPSDDILIYDKDNGIVNGSWVTTPYINTYEVHNWGNINKQGRFPKYKLRWR